MCVSTAAGPFVFGSAVGEYARILGRFIWNEYRMTMGSLWDHYRITTSSTWDARSVREYNPV